ncbi:hypothetical protein HanXRQr2_Chr04g0175671 [Helianthus annuus]|uniref:Uncharacterized protein n=1 Tax=Helianthus annuus TaxID=4232 RepID=A0A9K3NS94_HELAN|nr:hypothetical protein HanXRQr2_Chr04g0175671 [Helianthus annuus]KAJ0932079.1 hypothetical protein HanPSC8_Chr04g0169501 [Helianthus annuus]
MSSQGVIVLEQLSGHSPVFSKEKLRWSVLGIAILAAVVGSQAIIFGFRDTKHISNATESYLSLGNESLIEAERNSWVQKELFATLSIILVTVVCSLGLPVIMPSLAVRILIMAPLGINFLF